MVLGFAVASALREQPVGRDLASAGIANCWLVAAAGSAHNLCLKFVITYMTA
jgi:hypothetical protein